jgi:hypothetical protein
VGTAPGLWVSLRTPRPDRSLSRALLFQGDTDLAPVETRLVRAILERAGIAVDVLSSAEVTAAAFCAAYGSDEWDAIWVACHGQQPPYQPAAAEIELRAGEFVTTGAWLRAGLLPPISGRAQAQALESPARLRRAGACSGDGGLDGSPGDQAVIACRCGVSRRRLGIPGSLGSHGEPGGGRCRDGLPWRCRLACVRTRPERGAAPPGR